MEQQRGSKLKDQVAERKQAQRSSGGSQLKLKDGAAERKQAQRWSSREEANIEYQNTKGNSRQKNGGDGGGQTEQSKVIRPWLDRLHRHHQRHQGCVGASYGVRIANGHRRFSSCSSWRQVLGDLHGEEDR